MSVFFMHKFRYFTNLYLIVAPKVSFYLQKQKSTILRKHLAKRKVLIGIKDRIETKISQNIPLLPLLSLIKVFFCITNVFLKPFLFRYYTKKVGDVDDVDYMRLVVTTLTIS